MTNRNSNAHHNQMLCQDTELFLASNPATKELWLNLLQNQDITITDGVTGFLADAIMVALCTVDLIEDADLDDKLCAGSAFACVLKRLYPEELLSVEEITAVAKNAVDPVGTRNLELAWISHEKLTSGESSFSEELVHAE